MRIHGSSDFGPKPDATDAKRKDRGASSVQRTPQTRATDDVGNGARAEAKPAAPAEKVESEAVVLSASASRFAEVSSEHSEAVQARLAEVKKLLDAGEYQVDFDRLADNLLSEEVERSK